MLVTLLCWQGELVTASNADAISHMPRLESLRSRAKRSEGASINYVRREGVKKTVPNLRAHMEEIFSDKRGRGENGGRRKWKSP